MNQPLVSVIIPTYNRGYCVFKSIDSVLNQTYTNTQIILIDDGSTDDTSQKVKLYIPRIEYYYQVNQGQGAARNLGLMYAQGEFIATLDSDDYWHPEFLESHINHMVENDLVLSFSNYSVYNSEFGRMSQIDRMQPFFDADNPDKWCVIDGREFRKLVVPGVIIPSSGVVKHRRVMGIGWDPAAKIADDWILQLDIAIQDNLKMGYTFLKNWEKGHFGDNISIMGSSSIETTWKLYDSIHQDLIRVRFLFEKRFTRSERNYLIKKIINYKIEWIVYAVKVRKWVFKSALEGIWKLSIWAIPYFIYSGLIRIIRLTLFRILKK